MKHARPDYERFQDPALADPSLLAEGSSPIAEDEPVMLFRAKDEFAPRVLDAYDTILRSVAGDLPEDEARALYDVAIAVKHHAERMRGWQAANGCKKPDIPAVTS